MSTVKAIYEHGVFKQKEPVDLEGHGAGTQGSGNVSAPGWLSSADRVPNSSQAGGALRGERHGHPVVPFPRQTRHRP
jgi:hypothetical protein